MARGGDNKHLQSYDYHDYGKSLWQTNASSRIPRLPLARIQCPLGFSLINCAFAQIHLPEKDHSKGYVPTYRSVRPVANPILDMHLIPDASYAATPS